METIVAIFFFFHIALAVNNETPPPEQNQIEQRYEAMGWELPKDQE